MQWGAIVVAAGSGTRFGRPKQYIDIAGRPMVVWSLRALLTIPEIVEIVLVTESAFVLEAERLVAELDRSVRIVVGGSDRQASVVNGLAALTDRCEAVMIHDGARPLIAAVDIRRAMEVVAPGRGALLAVPLHDTVKLVDPTLRVRRTLDRGMLWAAQTPQLAMLADMRRAHALGDSTELRVTDDAALLEAAGVEVLVVAGDPENFKVTLPDDARRATAILERRR